MSYQVFISYRREGAEGLAQLFYDRLTQSGYQVFLDVETLRSGMFNQELYKVIGECEDFLLILPPNGLDRCEDSEDWVRKEVEYAIQCNKNIIPIMMRGFEFPVNLPSEMQKLPYYNGINANMEFFDAVVQRLKEMLKSVSKNKENEMYAVQPDPDFPEWIREEWRMRYLPDSEDSEKKLRTEYERYLNQNYPERKNVDKHVEYYKKRYDIEYGRKAFTPRKVLFEITRGMDVYRVYDIFEYTGTYANGKYAYAVKEEKEKLIPDMCFFYIASNEQLRMVSREEKTEFLELLEVYRVRRGFGCVPDCLLRSYVKMQEALLNNFEAVKVVLESGMLPEKFIKENEPFPFSEKLSKWERKKWVEQVLGKFFTNQKGSAIPVTLQGWLPRTLLYGKIPVRITVEDQIEPLQIKKDQDFKEDSIYFDTLRNLQQIISTPLHTLWYRCKVKTPLDGYTIVDMVRVNKLSNDFVLLCYPQKKHYIDKLERKPVLFAVFRNEKMELSIRQVRAENLEYYVSDWRERFALVAVLIEENADFVFDNTRLVY